MEPRFNIPRIGVTQKSDAAQNMDWLRQVPDLDGVILFTREPNMDFSFRSRNLQKPRIVHIRLSGWEGSRLQPGGMSLRDKIAWTARYLRDGFEPELLVLDFDPVVPDKNGLARFQTALDGCLKAGILPGARARIHVLKEYGCIKDELDAQRKKPFYPDFRVFPEENELARVAKAVRGKGLRLEVCSCDFLPDRYPDLFVKRSCISKLDYHLMGLDFPEMQEYYVRRHPDGCRCMPKIELSAGPCPNRCTTCPYRENH